MNNSTRISERYSLTPGEQYSRLLNDILRRTILLKILFDSYIVRLVHPMNNIQRLLNNIMHEQYSPRIYEQYYSEYRPTRILFIERKSNNIQRFLHEQ